ncbi:MAG TPA: DUF366 family protein [Candidatus Methanoperedenaceae archaeon]|nr:DUF366 family protein [Candidatus Methanoperedenaceae archaeon]
MRIHVLSQLLKYDGSQMDTLWAHTMGIHGDSIVVFRGAMDVLDEHMKDLEDRQAGKKIAGSDLIHFIVEKFDSPASMRLAYLMQRLLLECLVRALNEKGINCARESGDVYVSGKKLTVSIASAGVSSEKIHLGVNLSSRGVPRGVKAAGLFELGIDDWEDVGKHVAQGFADEMADIEGDIAKTRPL